MNVLHLIAVVLRNNGCPGFRAKISNVSQPIERFTPCVSLPIHSYTYLPTYDERRTRKRMMDVRGQSVAHCFFRLSGICPREVLDVEIHAFPRVASSVTPEKR